MAERKILNRVKTNRLDSIIYEDQVGIEWQPEIKSVRITMNRPETKNSMPIAFWDWLSSFITNNLDVNDEVKSWVLAAEGPNFGGGNDANELGYYIGFGTGKTETERKRPTQRQRIMADHIVYGAKGYEQAFHRALKVSICEVKGQTYGQHMALAMLADIVVAADDALFTHPAYRYLGPFSNPMPIIEKLGITKMKEMVLTAKVLTAQELAGQGHLITKMVPLKDLRKTTEEYARAISLLPMDGIYMGKAMIEQCLELRGYGFSFLQSWTAHPWSTNLSYGPDEFNFLKHRRDEGLTKALYERDKQAPKAWRLGKARFED